MPLRATNHIIMLRQIHALKAAWLDIIQSVKPRRISGTSRNLLPRFYRRSELRKTSRELKEWAERRGDKVIGVFKETASGAKNDRAERGGAGL